jgi:hypothetical protein
VSLLRPHTFRVSLPYIYNGDDDDEDHTQEWDPTPRTLRFLPSQPSLTSDSKRSNSTNGDTTSESVASNFGPCLIWSSTTDILTPLRFDAPQPHQSSFSFDKPITLLDIYQAAAFDKLFPGPTDSPTHQMDIKTVVLRIKSPTSALIPSAAVNTCPSAYLFTLVNSLLMILCCRPSRSCCEARVKFNEINGSLD